MYPDSTYLLVTEKYGKTEEVKMKIQYQYAAEIHPEVNEGKTPPLWEHMVPSQTRVDFKGIEYFVIKSNEFKKLLSSD